MIFGVFLAEIGCYLLLSRSSRARYGEDQSAFWVDLGRSVDADGDLVFFRLSQLRSLIEEESRAASAAAILGIIGFLDIPLIHMSVYWWRTLHQPPSILRPDKAPWENVHPAMLTALAINFVAFILLYFYLLSLRFRLGEMTEEIKTRKLNRG